jgi:hypothetical protein
MAKVKFDHKELVKEKINPLIDEVYKICEEHGIPFYSFMMVSGDEEAGGLEWCSSRYVPEGFGDKPSSMMLMDKIAVYIQTGELG